MAAAWARRLEFSLTILIVIEDVPPPLGKDPYDHRYGTSGNVEGYVDDLVQRWRGAVPETDGRVLRDPVGPASAIRAHLDQQPAGLVAVTTHARSGIRRAVLGATAASIVHASVAPCIVGRIRR